MVSIRQSFLSYLALPLLAAACRDAPSAPVEDDPLTATYMVAHFAYRDYRSLSLGPELLPGSVVLLHLVRDSSTGGRFVGDGKMEALGRIGDGAGGPTIRAPLWNGRKLGQFRVRGDTLWFLFEMREPEALWLTWRRGFVAEGHTYAVHYQDSLFSFEARLTRRFPGKP